MVSRPLMPYSNSELIYWETAVLAYLYNHGRRSKCPCFRLPTLDVVLSRDSTGHSVAATSRHARIESAIIGTAATAKAVAARIASPVLPKPLFNRPLRPATRPSDPAQAQAGTAPQLPA